MSVLKVVTSTGAIPSLDLDEATAAPLVTVPEVHEGGGVSFCAAELGRETVEFLGDEQWMSFVTGLLAIASHTCSLMDATGANEYVPYLSIVSGPLYLYHAVVEAKQRFQLMASACKTSRVSDAIFWAWGAVGSFGISLSNVVKPIAGAVFLFGVKSTMLHTVFSFIIPIILIVCSVFGGGNQAWALGKTEMARERFKQKTTGLKKLKDLQTVLQELQGPQEPAADSLAQHHFALDSKQFQSTHFTGAERREAVQAKIQALFDKQKKGEELLKQILPMMKKAKDLIGATESSLFERIDATLSLSKRTIKLARAQGIDVSALSKGRAELIALKNKLFQKGYEIIDTVESEIHRKIVGQNLVILNALMTLGAGILFLIAPASQYYLGFILSWTSSALGAIQVIFDKGVSQKSFLHIEQFFGTIRNRMENNPEIKLS